LLLASMFYIAQQSLTSHFHSYLATTGTRMNCSNHSNMWQQAT